MAKEYTIRSAMHIEDLMDELNELACEGWTLNYAIQEHAYTKIILEREKK